MVAELLLHLVEPLAVGLDEAPREAVVEEQVARAVGQLRGDRLGGVEPRVDLVEVVAQGPQPLERPRRIICTRSWGPAPPWPTRTSTA